MNVANRLVMVFGLIVYATAFGDSIPALPRNLKCLNNQSSAMGFNNETVIRWKTETSNDYHDRGFVKGVITDIYATQTNSKGKTHTKFALDIDQKAGGDIELVFNDEFEKLPRITVGMTVMACGDYITLNSRAASPSPMGAIIHWIHMNPGDRDGGKHPNGFLIIDNIPYGLKAPAQLN